MSTLATQFTGKFPLSKTIRFELIPRFGTKELLSGLFDSDYKRAELAPTVKEILNMYYQDFINICLEDANLQNVKIKGISALDYAFDAYRNNDSKKVTTANTALMSYVSKCFTDKNKFGLDEYLNLLKLEKKKSPTILVKWINEKVNKGIFSKEKAAEYKNAISFFDKFITYFSGFKKTKENMFKPEDKASSIAHRTISENLYRFFDNILLFDKISKKYPDLAKELLPFKDAFTIQYFATRINQNAIDEYNHNIIGSSSENIDHNGVNSILNAYRQKHHLRTKDIPVMSRLYKQILSDSEEKFFFLQVTSKEQALALINDTTLSLKTSCKKLQDLFSTYVIEDNSSHIYLKTSQLHTISMSLYNRWDLFDVAIKDKASTLSTKDSNQLLAKYKDVISIQELNNIFFNYYQSLDKDKQKEIGPIRNLTEYFQRAPKINISIDELKEKSITEFKTQLDTLLGPTHFYKAFHLYNGRKAISVPDRDISFYNEFEAAYRQLACASTTYDAIRNFATKKQYSLDKIPVFFGKSSLLISWENGYNAKSCLLFQQGNNYYLGILNKKLDETDIKKLHTDAIADPATRFIINSQKVDNKNVPRLFIHSKGDNLAPSVKKYNLPIQNILNLYTQGYYKTDYAKINPKKFKASLIKLIDYFKLGFSQHEDFKNFTFQWKESEEYNNINEFYHDVAVSCYAISKEHVNFSALKSLVKENKLYLFQIYNKDFSTHSHGTPNLHTLYWKALFDDRNNLNKVFKLNGGATIYLRKGSIAKKITHPKNQPIESKNPLHKKQSVFGYDLIKDKRFTEDKLFLHCPITINFKYPANIYLNNDVNNYLENHPEVNIIGIDRGERHLLYYTIIDQKGNILEQDTFNQIKYAYLDKKSNETVPVVVDYHTLLDNKQIQRTDARKAWETIENIKELKAGFLSQVIHQLAELVIKYNAIVVLENLNTRFKQTRVKVEKQVYQKFEKALIEKLNYLVFKDHQYDDLGSYAKGYQLTNPSDINQSGISQNGILFYIVPSYTSHICPKTGFVNLLTGKLHYKNIEASQEILKNFDGIKFNLANDYFEFKLDYRKFNIEMSQPCWTICTYGDERYAYTRTENNKTQVAKINVTQELKELFTKYEIDYTKGNNLLAKILELNDKSFFSSLLFLLNLTMQIRYTKPGTQDDCDYILSPIQYAKKSFFDSRFAQNNEPKNADANGAYNIALKGLKLICSIKDGALPKQEKGTERKEWFEFVQKKLYLDKD